jgi:hypothetical protein
VGCAISRSLSRHTPPIDPLRRGSPAKATDERSRPAAVKANPDVQRSKTARQYDRQTAVPRPVLPGKQLIDGGLLISAADEAVQLLGRRVEMCRHGSAGTAGIVSLEGVHDPCVL